jgi:hypothetical protein
MRRNTGERNTIVDYVSEVGGHAYFEIPVAGGDLWGRRYIDAVRIADAIPGCLAQRSD